MKRYNEIFRNKYPIIGCVHLLPLPGSVNFDNNLEKVYQRAVEEAIILEKNGVDGIIVENFGDAPFYPDGVPPWTVSCMTAIVDRILKVVTIPVGVNVLRNDARAAISIASSTDVSFIRINIHMHAMLTDQGIIQGKSYETLRLRNILGSDALILADINVKHAQAMVKPDLKQWTYDLQDRGKADAIIVSGSGTGKSIDQNELKMVHDVAEVPVLIGSGFTPQISGDLLQLSDGAIVGSYLKKSGKVKNQIDPHRVKEVIKSVRNGHN